MIDIEKLDNKLYSVKYSFYPKGDKESLWHAIRNNREILKEAIKIKRNKWNNGDTILGINIAVEMLNDYENVFEDIYNELINIIYINRDIARLVPNGGNSLLLLSLTNLNLKLTEDKKAFAVSEAMNKIGTMKYQQKENAYAKMLDNEGITNEEKTIINIDGDNYIVGLKSKKEYFNYLANILSDTQAHGVGAFDIRYYILKNSNWTMEEKQNLIWDFYADSNTYDNYLETWESNVYNELLNYNERNTTITREDLFNKYTYENILVYCKKEIDTKRFWEEIEFCKEMHKLRPEQWELTLSLRKKQLK